MAKTIWVVRVGFTSNVSPSFLDCLRYAGLAKPHRDGLQGFDLYPPMGTGDTKVWAEQNASRMITHGFTTSVVKAGTPV